MKITQNQLRKIIREELLHLNEIGSRHGSHTELSLADLLFEEEEEKPELTGEPGADLETAFKAGPEGVRAFMDSNKDEGVTNVLAHAAEEYDGSADDDMITIGGATPKKVSGLGPTQQFIDLMQSVSFPLGSAKVLDGAISSKTSGAPGSISISGGAILDGHHRWSGVYAITPDGAISAKDFGFPGGVKEKLAAAQMAVAAVKKGKGQPSKGGGADTDIIGKGKDAIVAMIDANKGNQTDEKAPGPLLNDEMIQSIANGDFPGVNKWAGIPDDAKFVSLEESEAGFENDPIRKAIAEKIGGNLASLPQPLAGAPESREDMPQLDHEDIGGDTGLDKIVKGLPAGEYNVVPPFAKKEEAWKPSGDLILERWQRLAGLNEAGPEDDWAQGAPPASRSGSHIELEDARSMFPDAMVMLEKNLLDWTIGADFSPGDFETGVPTQEKILSESEFFIANGALVHWWDDMDSPYGAGSDAYLMWAGTDWINIDNASLDIVNQVRR